MSKDNPFYWENSDKVRAMREEESIAFSNYLTPVNEEELEELVECFMCLCRVATDIATTTPAGWCCNDCRENMS